MTIGFLVFAAGTILTSAEPFAEGLVGTGKLLGIDEFDREVLERDQGPSGTGPDRRSVVAGEP